MSSKADGTGHLYHSRASILFSVRGAAANLSSALPRAESEGVLTSIERMKINSAIVALLQVVEESSKNWSDVIKPRLLQAIKEQPHETEETQPERIEDNSSQGQDSSGDDNSRQNEEPGDSTIQNQNTGS